MNSLPTRASRVNKQRNRKPYERPPSPAPQLTRSKSSFFHTLKNLVSSWWSGESNRSTEETGEKQLKRRASGTELENGHAKRMRTRSPPRDGGYLDPPESMLRPMGSLGRHSKVTSDKRSQLSVRNTPLAFGSYRPPRSPVRRTPSIGAWFPQPVSTRNSLAPRPSQVHFGTLPNLNVDAPIASYDDSQMRSASPLAGIGVGLGRDRTPSKSMLAREASISLAGRTSLSRATGSSLRASLSAPNPFASLRKPSAAPERRKSTLIWDDTHGITSVQDGKPKGRSVPAKNTAERLLNALENMHTHTSDAQRPRRRPPPGVQVPTPGSSVPDRLKRMIQPYGEVKVGSNKTRKAERRPKSGLVKMLTKNKKKVQEIEEVPKPVEPEKPAPPAPVVEKAMVVVEDVDTEVEPQPAPAPAPASTTASPALKVIDNFRPASQPPSRPGSSLRQSKSVTKRAHAPSAGRNRFSANNDEEEDDEEAIEKRNAELLAAANAHTFKVPEGFKFGSAPTLAIPTSNPVELPKADPKVVVSPQPISAKPVPTPVLSFMPVASVPVKEAASPAPTFFGDKVGDKAVLPEIKNPFANLDTTKSEIKVPEVPKWGSALPLSAPTPPPKPVEGGSPFVNIGVPAKTNETATPFLFGKPKESEAKPEFGRPASTDSKPVVDNPFANIGKPTGDNPFVGIGTTKPAAAVPALPFSFGATKAESAPAPAVPSQFSKPSEITKPAEESKPVEAPKLAEAPKPQIEIPKPVVEPPMPVEAPKPAAEPPKSSSPFSFAVQPAEKPVTPAPFSFAAPAAAPASTPNPAPAPAPVSSFGASSVPVSTPAASVLGTKPTFTFGLPATTPPPTTTPAAEVPKKSPFDFPTPVAAPAPEAPKKGPFDFSSTTPVTTAPAPFASSTSKSPFDFSAAVKPVDKPASPFTFGAHTAPAAPATEKKSPFDFSGTSKPTATSFTFGASSTPASSTTSGFTFSAPAPARLSTPPSGGDAAMEESPTREPAKIVTSGFNSQPASTGFTFGSTANGTSSGPFASATSDTSSSRPFGGPLNGASTMSSGFGNAVPVSPAPFTFGAGNNTGSGFGSNSTAGTGFNSAGSGFGTSGTAAPSTAPAFTFNAGGGFGQPASATASASNPFTQPNPTPFGQPNPAPGNVFSTPASPFPAASPALSTVGFNTVNSAPSNNAFGSSQPATNGFPASPATPAFAFGATAPAAGTASPSTFTFGLPTGTSAPATPTSTTAPFVFGQGATAPVSEGSPAAGVQFNLGTADASPGGRKIKPLRRTRRT